MKVNLWAVRLLTRGLILTFTLILLGCLPTNGAQPVEPPSTGSASQAMPTVAASAAPRASAAITHTSAVALNLPLLAKACGLPPGAQPDTTVTLQEAPLYAGPGNLGYEILAELEPCTLVSANGVFGEFFRAEATVAGRATEGFLHESSLLPVAAELPILDQGEVPWQYVDFANYLGLQPDVIVRGTDVIVDNSGNDDYNDDLPLALTLDAGFELAFQIQTSDGEYGSIKLADKPNSTAEDWWAGIRRVDFATYDGQLEVSLRDGISESSATTIALDLPDDEPIRVVFLDPFGTVFLILDEIGREIRRVDVAQLTDVSLPHGLFPQRAVYLGRVASPSSQLAINSLSLHLAPLGAWKKPPAVAVEPTLRQLGETLGISTGTEYSWWLMPDPRYWDTMFHAYKTVVLSDFSSTSFWRDRGDYDFALLDHQVDWAVKNGFRVRASHLVWGALDPQVVPDWILNEEFSRDEYIQILHEHVATVVGHYKGRVAEWSIANEAIGRSFWNGDFWGEKIGPEYIEMAFRWAREADPAATLIFNEDNNHSLADPETEAVTSKMLDTVRSLKARGAPVDVVGMQMHLLLPSNSQTPPVKGDVIRVMQEFGALGVKIYITEFDVNLQDIAGTQDERWEFEAQIYRDMANACLESGVCASFTTWGVSDADSWLTCADGPWCLELPDADPLMFDVDYQPKPAFWAVHGAFASVPAKKR